MPIPELNDEGLLPCGIHDCTMEEIHEIFGRFMSCDRRPKLMAKLSQYVEHVKESGVAKYLIIDGSFVTSKEEPGDIDILMVLDESTDLASGIVVPPFVYNAQAKKYVKKEYGFDFFVGFENDDSSTKIIDFFRRVKEKPDSEKGILRLVAK
jgi:hypothetical protein